MRLRKLTIGLVGSVLALAGVTGIHAAAATNDNGWAVPNDVSPGTESVLFQDASSGEQYSYLALDSAINDKTQDPTCANAVSTPCATNTYQWSALLPQCLTSSDNNCISAFGAIKADGTKIEGKFSNYFPLKAQNEYTGFDMLPSGVSGSLYTIPGVTHQGGDKFYVSVHMNGNSGLGFTQGQTPSPMLDAFSAQIVPVDLEQVSFVGHGCGDTSCPNAGFAKIKDLKGGTFWGQQSPGWDGLHNCVATSAVDSMCGQKFGFPADTRFYLEIRTNIPPYGWLHGRLSDPTVKIDYKLAPAGLSRGSDVDTIYIEAAPVQTPIVYKTYNWADMPAPLKSLYNSSTGDWLAGGSGGGYSRIPSSGGITDPLLRNYTTAPYPDGSTSLDQLKAWLPYVNDKATASPTVWSIRSLSRSQLGASLPCYGDKTKLSGVVTTNSTVYSPGPPSYNAALGSLDYQVGAPHYTSSGDVFKGNYDLLMASSVARCIYGFSAAPIKATVSVISSDGSPQVATTVVNENNGWLHMRAANFEFSTPKIEVKLSQDAPAPTATPSTTPASTSASATAQASAPVVAKKITITCIKGKTSKSVTAVKPTCPAGYKKK